MPRAMLRQRIAADPGARPPSQQSIQGSVRYGTLPVYLGFIYVICTMYKKIHIHTWIATRY